jgi:DNA-binding beta-propeller fold protein YncE
VSVDGCTLLVSDGASRGSHTIHEISVVDSSRRRVIGGAGDGPLRFKGPRQVCIASDGFVFIADAGNDRVQVLTPTLDFHCFIGQGQLERPVGVCANADVVVVSESDAHRVSVFKRRDGALLRRFASVGRGSGQLMAPCGLCYTCHYYFV